SKYFHFLLRLTCDTLRRMSESLTNPTPQFSTAEYAPKPGADQCKTCNKPLGATYYRVNGVAACGDCAKRVENARPKDNRRNYIRALIFGGVGAVLGLAVYATFEIATGWIIGYLSLAVGYIVAKAMMMGSEGIGGRRYQITAVVLTYMAVSLAVLPIIFWQAAKQRDAHGPASIERSASPQKAPNRLPADATPGQAAIVFVKAIVVLLGIGLASPFLALNDPFSGAIGLFILFIGMKIAWKMTAGQPIEIHGPYQSASPALDQVSAG
nr:hypothetical protein [Candidatus Acidoferrales bacterium]